jgi:hypothetical protein
LAFQDGSHSVLLWNPEKEAQPRLLQGHPDACQQLLFTHDGKRLIAGAGTHNNYSSQTIWVWDVATAKVAFKLPTHSAPGQMLLTADGRMLITGGLYNDATVNVWDVEEGAPLATISDPSLKTTSKEENAHEAMLAIASLGLSPDERFLAVVTNAADTAYVSVWETATWKPVRVFGPTRPRNYAASIVFSADRRALFVANSDSTILEWDVSGLHGNKATAPDAKRLDALWEKLQQPPDVAYPAAWELLASRAEAIRYLKTKLTPVKSVDEKPVRELVARLDADNFEQREDASKQLLALGEPAAPALGRFLRQSLSPEVKRRVETILKSLNGPPTSEQQRSLRALAVLEWSGGGDEMLQQLADGAPSSRITQAAKVALRRTQRSQ